MKRTGKGSTIGSALAATFVLMGGLTGSRPAAAHCGEHADSCGPSDWQEVGDGECVDAADPFEYGTFWQAYEVYATWCTVPVRCFPDVCRAESPCGLGGMCVDVNGVCSCLPGKQLPCANCTVACHYPQSLSFEDDSRCWPWGIEHEVPCDGPLSGGAWRNHGAYVRAVAHLLNDAAGDGLITPAQHDALMEATGQSSCGS